MATADIQEYLSERDCGHKLFSMQHCEQLTMKVVRIDGVVQKFIDSETISEAEKNSFVDKKVADQKFKHLLTIITDHCNRNDLQALKTFIDILGYTNNVFMAQQLSLIYDERVNYFATLSLLLKEKSLVRNVENEIRCLQSILDEKKRCLESLTDKKNKLVIQKETSREENFSLEKQIKKIEKDLLFVEKEMGELTRTINNIEIEVEHKSYVIRKRDKEIAEKEREVREAIEESNRLRLKIDTLQQQHSEAMVEDKEMSMKIEILENGIGEKENTIMNLRKNKTMTRKGVEEELGNIMKGQEKKMDDQTAMMEQQKETIDSLAKTQMQQNEKIDVLTDAHRMVLKFQENK